MSWSVAFSKAARTSQVSNYTVLTLFFTSLLGILIANETPNAATLCGGVYAPMRLYIGYAPVKVGGTTFLAKEFHHQSAAYIGDV